MSSICHISACLHSLFVILPHFPIVHTPTSPTPPSLPITYTGLMVNFLCQSASKRDIVIHCQQNVSAIKMLIKVLMLVEMDHFDQCPLHFAQYTFWRLSFLLHWHWFMVRLFVKLHTHLVSWSYCYFQRRPRLSSFLATDYFGVKRPTKGLFYVNEWGIT